MKDLLAQMTAKQNEIADLTLDLSGQKKNYDVSSAKPSLLSP